MVQDLVNGCFEVSGGFFILLSILKLYKDKEVKGVHIVQVVFFLAWGFWNLYYYSHLKQWLSLAGGVWLAVANLWWVVLMWYYTRYPGGSNARQASD